MPKLATSEQVLAGIRRYGDRATVVTVAGDGRPHVASSLVRADGELLVVGVGRRSREHLEQRPFVTLVWNPADGDEYQLIVDGTAALIAEPDERGVSEARITIDGGIQHRLAGLAGGGSSCRAVDAV